MQFDMFADPVFRTDPRHVFWSRRYEWPNSTAEFLFLAELVLLVGPNLHPQTWTGDEPTSVSVEPLPDEYRIDIAAHQLRWAGILLRTTSEAYKERCNECGGLAMPTASEWSEAVKLSREKAVEASEALNRFWDVCDRLAYDFRSRHLQTAIRPFDGGSIERITADAWNTENWWSRFHTCQVDREKPFSRNVVSSGGHYIFVERESLARLAGGAQKPKRDMTITADQYLSPYLKCMIRASKELGLTEGEQPKKEELILRLPEFWEGVEPLTPTDLERMATCIRAPDRKLGRGRKAE